MPILQHEETETQRLGNLIRLGGPYFLVCLGQSQFMPVVLVQLLKAPPFITLMNYPVWMINYMVTYQGPTVNNEQRQGSIQVVWSQKQKPVTETYSLPSPTFQEEDSKRR